MMKWRDLKIGWRLLIKEPAHSLIVIIGLSVSFAACFLLLGYAKYSFDYDSHIPDADRVFLVKHRLNAFSRPVWVDFLTGGQKDAMATSGVPHDFVMFWSGRQMLVTKKNVPEPVNVALVSANFSQIFAVKALQGDLTATLSKPDAIAITVRTATRLFGSQKVLGDVIKIDGKAFAIGAVVQDPPSNTTRGFEALIGSKNAWGRGYIKLPSNVDATMVENLLQGYAENSGIGKSIQDTWFVGAKPRSAKKEIIEVRLTSVKDAYFDRDLGNFEDVTRGDKGVVTALAVVAIFILLMASTSFINLTVVRTIRRQKEIGVYKMLGADRGRIIAQFVAESLFLTLLASGLGLLLAWLILPVFSDLMNRPLENLFSMLNLGVSLGFSLVIGLLLSVYPTWIAFKVNTNQALVGRGNSESVAGRRLRRVFTIFQIASAIAFSAAALAIAWQTSYATKTSLGFNSDNLLVLNMRSRSLEEKKVAFRDGLLRISGVRDLASSNSAAGRDFIGNNGKMKLADGRSVVPVTHSVSANFFGMHGVKAVAGRVFDPTIDAPENTEHIIFNEAAIKALGFTSPQSAIGQFVEDSDKAAQAPKQIIGVVPNLRFQSIRQQESARSFELDTRAQYLIIQVDSDLAEAQTKIAKLWQEFYPNESLDMVTSASLVAQNNAEDIRLMKLLIAAAILALLISAFGIYVLSAYSVQRRAQEIAIRKIHGAKARAIAVLVGKEMAHVVLIGALIGIPVGAWAIWVYLASFAEHAPIGVWTLLFSLVMVIGVVVAASMKHTFLAIRTLPSTVLRD